MPKHVVGKKPEPKVLTFKHKNPYVEADFEKYLSEQRKDGLPILNKQSIKLIMLSVGQYIESSMFEHATFEEIMKFLNFKHKNPGSRKTAMTRLIWYCNFVNLPEVSAALHKARLEIQKEVDSKKYDSKDYDMEIFDKLLKEAKQYAGVDDWQTYCLVFGHKFISAGLAELVNTAIVPSASDATEKLMNYIILPKKGNGVWHIRRSKTERIIKLTIDQPDLLKYLRELVKEQDPESESWPMLFQRRNVITLRKLIERRIHQAWSDDKSRKSALPSIMRQMVSSSPEIMQKVEAANEAVQQFGHTVETHGTQYGKFAK
jgi:hypothetical protein